MKILKELLGWFGSIAMGFSLAMLINLFIFQPSEVLGSSMQPTLNQGNIIIMSKLLHTFRLEPAYSDIVIIDSRVDRKHSFKDDLIDSLSSNVIASKVFKHRNNNYWVKRVIGKPGDVLEFKDGKVYRNGIALEEPYINGSMNYTSTEKITVPEKHVFVMGDNRNSSSDSRNIGCVPLENVVGKLVLKFRG